MSKIASLNPRKTLVRSAAGAALLAAGLGLGWLPAAASAAAHGVHLGRLAIVVLAGVRRAVFNTAAPGERSE